MPNSKVETAADLVSIITPNYNGAKYISETIKSVVAQAYPNWEMIIVDDCSSDNSVSIIETFQSDPRIKLIRLEKNGGTIKARNIGIEQSFGRYICFLDSDDKWMPEKLQIQLTHMDDFEVAFCFSSYQMIDSEEKWINTFIAPPDVNYKKLLVTCDVGCSTVIYDTHVLGKQFFNSASPRAREDYVLWLSIARNYPGIKMCGIETPLMVYRKHDKGISSNKSKAALNNWRVYRNIEKLGYLQSMYYWIQYAFHGFKKHYF